MGNIKLPNFLIVGAAKAGTTSLYHYLKEHPEIYLSPVKEPKFITSQFLKFPFRGIGDSRIEKEIVKDYNEYVGLFRGVKGEKAIGEASADTLYYYEKSIPVIKNLLGNPKIIIILRNPVDRAFSAYLHLVRDRREFESFEKGLELEPKRRAENWEFIWYYVDVGFYYRQVKAFLENFSDVRVYLFEDLKESPETLLKDVFNFLGVKEDFIPSNLREKYNVSGVPKNKYLQDFLVGRSRLSRLVAPFVKLTLPKKARDKLVQKMMSRNLRKITMEPATRRKLVEIFREDILKLQDLLGRDLTHWLEE